MKARIENGQIKIYAKLPSKYLSDTLNIAGGFHQLPTEIIEQEDFYDVLIPEFDGQTQALGDMYFDETNKVFTYPVEDIEFELEELKQRLFKRFDAVLNDFAVIIARCKFIHDPAPPELLQAIEAAKQTRLNTLNAIHALSTIEAALAFRIREEDVEALRSLFTPFL